MYTLILLDQNGKPWRTIGPFEYEDMPTEWMKEQSINSDHIILPLEPHGWDQ